MLHENERIKPLARLIGFIIVLKAEHRGCKILAIEIEIIDVKKIIEAGLEH
jgi:hypothetical protein